MEELVAARDPPALQRLATHTPSWVVVARDNNGARRALDELRRWSDVVVRAMPTALDGCAHSCCSSATLCRGCC